MPRVPAWLRPPALDDPFDAVRARLLHLLLLTCTAIMVPSLAVSLIRPGRHMPTVFAAYGTLAAVMLAAFALVRRGYVRTATLGFASLLWLTVTALSWFYGGISGQHLVTLVVCVLVAGFCAGGIYGVAFAVVTMASVALVVMAEVGGWLPVPIQAPTPWDRYQSFAVAIALSGAIVAIAMSALENSMRELREREALLAEARRRDAARARQGEALGRLGRALTEASDVSRFGCEVVSAIASSTRYADAAVYGLQGLRLVRIAPAPDEAGGDAAASRWPAEIEAEASQALLAGVDAESRALRLPRFVDATGSSLGIPLLGSAGLAGAVFATGGAPDAARDGLPEGDELFVRTAARMLAAVMEHERVETERRQSQKMEAVGQLAATIAHDFNNLLTALVGSAEMLHDSLPELDERQEYVREVLLASDRAAMLTKRLLSFARVERARPGPVDLGQAVREFAPMLERLLGEGVATRIVTADEPLPVLADRGLLDQVLLNLAVNARDALPEAGGMVEIATRSVGGDDARQALLTVRDTGKGMDSHTLARVFEPFFTTKPPGKGTGIGLSTVRRIVAELGGEVEATSRPGAGATFFVRLPLCVARSQPLPEELPGPSETASGRRLLLVEDNEIVRRTTEGILSGAGYEVHAVSNGPAALRRLDELGPVDLVVSDVVMPEMSGLSLADAIAERPDAPPVLLMSGFHPAAAAPQARECEILQKPFTPAQLLAGVRRNLGPRRAR